MERILFVSIPIIISLIITILIQWITRKGQKLILILLAGALMIAISGIFIGILVKIGGTNVNYLIFFSLFLLFILGVLVLFSGIVSYHFEDYSGEKIPGMITLLLFSAYLCLNSVTIIYMILGVTIATAAVYFWKWKIKKSKINDENREILKEADRIRKDLVHRFSWHNWQW